MKIWKNLFGTNDKLHSDVIAVGEKGNSETLTDAINKKVEIVTHGRSAGVVIDMELENHSIYLLAVGRDQGLYLISTHNEIIISTILDMAGGKSITGNGLNLVVDFQTRNRAYALLRLG